MEFLVKFLTGVLSSLWELPLLIVQAIKNIRERKRKRKLLKYYAENIDMENEFVRGFVEHQNTPTRDNAFTCKYCTECYGLNLKLKAICKKFSCPNKWDIMKALIDEEKKGN